MMRSTTSSRKPGLFDEEETRRFERAAVAALSDGTLPAAGREGG